MDPYNHQNNYGPPPPNFIPNMGAPMGYPRPPMHMPGMPPPFRPSYPMMPFPGSSMVAPPYIARPPVQPINYSSPQSFVPPAVVVPSKPALTLFIGGISPGVTDDDMNKILNCFGSLKSWSRPKDTSGVSKAFGFADFTEPESILNLLLILSEKDRPVRLPSPAPGVELKTLVIKYEDDVKKALDLHKRTRPDTAKEQELAETLAQQVNIIISQMPGYQPPEERASAEANKKKKKGKATPSPSSSDNEFSEEERDIERFQNMEEQRTRQRAEEYYDKLKRWEERELSRSKAHEKSKLREREIEERRELDRQEHAKRFSEWDDDKELELGREDYYKDRARWWEKRQLIRQRELEQDEMDREKVRMEEVAKRAEKERREWEAANPPKLIEPESQPEAIPDTKPETDDKPKVTPEINGSKIKFSLKPSLSNPLLKKIKGNSASASPSPAKLDIHGDDPFDDESKKAKRVLIPLQYSDDEDQNDAKRRKSGDRKTQLKKIMDSIPAAHQDLWIWPVKWDYLDESAIQKVKTFADKKIVEYIGQHENQLLSFVVEHLKLHAKPQFLVEELKKALGDEGQMFVMKLWRMIIFETEVKAQNL